MTDLIPRTEAKAAAGLGLTHTAIQRRLDAIPAVHSNLTALVEALRFADETFRDLGWHSKWEVTSAALEKCGGAA